MNKIVEVENISYAYEYKKEVFNNINFYINAGDFVGLLGKNGSGKTTIIEMLIGFRNPDSGTIKIFNELTISKRRDYIKSIAFISHDIQINPELKISDYLKHHEFFFENYSKEIEKETSELLKVNLKKKINDLSTGQKKKVQIISALSSNAPLIIIDEVTAVLDPKSREDFLNLLSEHNKKLNRSIILATNIVDDLKNHCSKVIYLNKNSAELIAANEINSIFNIKDSK